MFKTNFFLLLFFPQHETLKVQLAMEHLAVIARQHHRSRQTAGFMISTALPVFCRCILQNPDALAIDRTEKTLNRTLVSNMYLLVFQHLPNCVTNVYVCKFSMFFRSNFRYQHVVSIPMGLVWIKAWTWTARDFGDKVICFHGGELCVIFFYLRITMRRQRFCFTRSEFTYTLGGAQNMKNSSGWETYDISLISDIYTWMFSYICKSSTKTEVLKGYV